ncbi:ABC transporter family carbohydrate exporter [Sorangium cellulosum So ce56]|uniref:ABC transporter family carbohydrate exporter n=1 Tax=Sorangium cellulosum (strain So ce56) TaxID=448385 RepID=A9GA35_SORC5|nr:ABC transporter family carbohydrate exporter [Sorangium cellulosum So ce56]
MRARWAPQDISVEPKTSLQRAPGAPVLPDTPFRFIIHFVGRYRAWYLAMFVFESAHASCGIMIPYAIGQVIQGVTQASGAGRAVLSGRLRDALALFVALIAGEFLFSRIAGLCQILVGPWQRQNVTRNLYAYLQHHSHRYFSNNFAGALAHRISETSMGVSQTLWAILFDFWPIAIVFSVSIGLLYRAHPALAAVVSAWAVLFVGISYWLATRCQPHAVRAASARSETTGKLVDSVTNLTSARLFARFGFERAYLDEQLKHELRAVRRSNWYSERVRWFQFASAALLKVGTLYQALRLWERGDIGVAEFVMATSLSLLIINEARNLSRRFLEFFEFVGNVANGVNTIVRSHELVDRPEAVAPTLERGRIELRNVTFGYTPGQPIFEGLDVTIPRGQRVGLVGFSGSGKSTFVSLILRLYDIDSGHILIDGVDIRDMTQDALHAQLSLIPQDPSLFHRTLLENIRYGRLNATDAEVVEAARKAHAHEFIVQMKDQYHSMVGERGVKLSGGQRQRIAIARVIVKDAPILLLDEATSSLDSITEQAIQDTMDGVMKGKTVLVVAHRLSTVVHLDRILVFEDGRIIEDGTHAELLARNGAYKRLWSKQSDGFLPESAAEAPAAMEAPPARVHEAPRLQPAADRADELPRGAPLKAWEAPLA